MMLKAIINTLWNTTGQVRLGKNFPSAIISDVANVTITTYIAAMHISMNQIKPN